MEEGLPLLSVSPLLLSSIFGLFLVSYLLRYRQKPGAASLAALSMAAVIWSGGYAVEMLAPGLETKVLSAKVQYLGIAPLPMAWFFFSIHRFGAAGWLARAYKYRLALWIMPAATCILAWTNGLHGLVWREVSLMQLGPVQVLDLVYGPYFWLNLALSYLLIFWGSVRMALHLSGSLSLYRWQIVLALLAMIIPMAANLAYVLDASPVQGLDWTPFALIISSFFFTLSLVRFQLINILPIAQAIVLEELPDALLVLDARQRILEFNPAARRLLRGAAFTAKDSTSASVRNAGKHISTSARLLGMPLDRLSHPLARWVQETGCTQESRRSVELAEGDVQRFYELHIKPLYGEYPDPIGCLVVLHDITRQRKDQAALEQARDRLEEAVAERTASLQEALARVEMVQEFERRQLVTELHDRVGQNLTGLSLNLQAARNLCNPASDDGLLNRLDASIQLLEETTREVRGVMAELYPPMLDENGLVPTLRWYCSVFTQQCDIPASVSGNENWPRLPRKVEMMLFRIVQESLNNVARHACANRVKIHVEAGKQTARLTIEDNGQGFDVSELHAGLDQPHWGLITMQQRAAAIGADLSIDSAPGQGTRIAVQIRR